MSPARSPWPLTLLFAFGHLVLAAALPLIEDEAYYALWASRPAWGYYDHPPVIAWMIALGEGALGRTPLGIRAVPVVAMALAAPLVWRMAQLAAGEVRTALRAMLLWLVAPLVLALGSGAGPDAPSVLFWAATLWALAEALSRPGGGDGFWLLAGVAAGLGILSKFTNLFMPVGIFVWLVATRGGRAALVTWRPWAAAATMLATLVPLAIWNAQNGWIGLERQFGRIAPGQWSLATLAAFAATAWLVFSPVGAAFVVRGVGRGAGGDDGRAGGAGEARHAGAITGLLAVTSAPLAAYLLWHATQHEVPANWIVPLHAPAAVLAALGLAQARRGRRWTRAAIAASAGLGAVVLGLAFKPGTPLFNAHAPPNQWRGWAEAVPALERAAAAAGAEWIATAQYGLTGHLWWHLPDRPVWQVTRPERYLFRPPMPHELCRAPALLVERADRPGRAAALFDRVGPAREVARRGGEAVLYTFRLTPVRGLRDCPPRWSPRAADG